VRSAGSFLALPDGVGGQIDVGSLAVQEAGGFG
jgi:hypothetical protein